MFCFSLTFFSTYPYKMTQITLENRLDYQKEIFSLFIYRNNKLGWFVLCSTSKLDWQHFNLLQLEICSHCRKCNSSKRVAYTETCLLYTCFFTSLHRKWCRGNMANVESWVENNPQKSSSIWWIIIWDNFFWIIHF